MAISYLGLSEKDFWNESPRRLLAMIEQWKRVQRSLLGIPENEEESTQPSAAMWAAWDAM